MKSAALFAIFMASAQCSGDSSAKAIMARISAPFIFDG